MKVWVREKAREREREMKRNIMEREVSRGETF